MLIVFIRVFIIYLLIIASLRLMGKRQLGQLQPSELVVTILVSNIATMGIEDNNVPLLSGIIPILSLVCFDVIVSAITLKSRKARRIVSGTPRVLIRDGKIIQEEMYELRFTVDDIMSQLRTNNIFDLQEVSFAIVETTGVLSVYPKFEARPVTAQMLNLPTPPGADAPPAILISDGVVIDSALQYCNLKYEWLERTVTQHNLFTKDIFLMSCDRQASYLIIPKDRSKHPIVSPDQKEKQLQEQEQQALQKKEREKHDQQQAHQAKPTTKKPPAKQADDSGKGGRP